jgi:hypothetical protein
MNAKMERPPTDTLRAALREFFRHQSPRTIAATAGASWLGRLMAGPFGPKDAFIVAGVIAWWPLQEWLAHKYLLHREPLPGRQDPLFAQRHRAHHRNPDDFNLTLLPKEVLETAIPASLAFWLLATKKKRHALTGMAAYSTMALVYEWSHFLVHTDYKPKSKFFRKVRRNHLMHHFRNENYWFGFTSPLVDALMGTDPEPAEVPRSETATDLYGVSAVDEAAE